MQKPYAWMSMLVLLSVTFLANRKQVIRKSAERAISVTVTKFHECACSMCFFYRKVSTKILHVLVYERNQSEITDEAECVWKIAHGSSVAE